MPRSTNAPARKQRHKKMLKQAKGAWGSRSKYYRRAHETVERALRYATRDRKVRTREFRTLWIIRINAAARECGMSYSRLIAGLAKAEIEIDRKVLADLAVNDPEAFAAIAHKAQSALS
jgi:large subunit ribosomal protein L20